MPGTDPYARFKTQDVDCPNCGEPITLGEDNLETVVTCDHCGTRSKVWYDDATDGAGFYLREVERPCAHPRALWESCDQCRSAQAGN